MSIFTTNNRNRDARRHSSRVVVNAKRIAAAALAMITLASAAACGSASSDNLSSAPKKSQTTKIVVGVCPGPYGDMVNKVIAPLLKDDGYELSTKLFNDYVQPNKALASGSLQANLFQHSNYLNKFKADNNLALTPLGQVPTLGLGIYSHKYKSVSEIKDGSTVSIASDGSNLARSLGVLEQQKLVTLKGNVDPTKATVNDIATNPKNLVIKPLDAAQLARSLSTVDVSLVPGNFAWAAGLKPKEALAMEKQSEGVINIFVVNTKDANSDFGKKTKALLVSDKFKKAIANSEFADFGKPTTW
ncbi:metal ABC transporter substrate-binding protein [Bifidobacterium tibiigranuli]|jgi:D-methionine transport system substrate-binding protein|uniref:Lipoprotein n=2 Tax=Bifidobacterium TaxID=1678 RepID=A0A5N6RXK6_9BIFI|nr:metal ABC transporter substrate-binding protein [Bifidobacterium tibiigranuli]KAE8126369.1 metal ABC transporter substrate-binding protein [Bifidobacterium tibiigranuli]